MNQFLLLAQENNDAAGAMGALCGLLCNCGILLVVVVPTIAGMWKIFEKAGQPGWAAIVPIYNVYVLTQIAGKEILWFILALVPCVQIVALVMIWMEVAKRFGKDPIFGIGLAFLAPIFAPLLGFSNAVYTPAPPAGPPTY
jgi:hypothetical protein